MLSPPMSPYDPPLARASTVWQPGSPSLSCSGTSVPTSFPAQRGPLEELGDPGLSRKCEHTGGRLPEGDGEEAVRKNSWCRTNSSHSNMTTSWPLVFVWGCVPPGHAAAVPVGLDSAVGWKGLRAAGWGLGIGPTVYRATEQSQTPGWSVPGFG